MQKEIKCPQCGGSRFKDTEEEGVYKCLYCGSIFYKRQDMDKSDDMVETDQPFFGEPIEPANQYYKIHSWEKSGETGNGCMVPLCVVAVLFILLFILLLF